MQTPAHWRYLRPRVRVNEGVATVGEFASGVVGVTRSTDLQQYVLFCILTICNISYFPFWF